MHPFNCSMVKSLINYHFIDKNSTFSLVWSYYLLLENNNCVRNSLPMNPSCHVTKLFLIVKSSRKFNAFYVRVDVRSMQKVKGSNTASDHLYFQYLMLFDILILNISEFLIALYLQKSSAHSINVTAPHLFIACVEVHEGVT